MLLRGYRNLCVILDFQMTLHSSESWIYQVSVLFIAMIITDHKRSDVHVQILNAISL